MEIKNALGYFVPDFFAESYHRYYPYQNMYSYCRLLLIPKERVIEAYNNTNICYDYTCLVKYRVFRMEHA